MALKRSGVLADDLEGQDDCPGVEDMDAFSLQNRLQELSSTVGFSSARGATQQSEAPQPAQTPEVNTTLRQVVAVRVGLPPVDPVVANVKRSFVLPWPTGPDCDRSGSSCLWTLRTRALRWRFISSARAANGRKQTSSPFRYPAKAARVSSKPFEPLAPPDRSAW